MGASASMMEIEGNPELSGKIKQDYENLKNEVNEKYLEIFLTKFRFF